MRKIVMLDYLSECDERGKPVGHRIKAGNEYYSFLKDEFKVRVSANEEVLEFYEAPDRERLGCPPQKNDAGKAKKLKYLKNIREIYRRYPEDVIWFFAPDIYAYIAMLLFNKGRRKIAVTVCEEHATNRIKHWIFRQALKKADIVFASNRHYKKYAQNAVAVPDYTYKPEFYSRYDSEEKKDRVVCLGTMNEKKLLTEAVDIFNKNGFPLYIAGQFASKERYRQLCEMKAGNITIEDRYIDEEEYYRLLGESRFSLLPYDEGFYLNRTSGVLQESLFLNTVPIAHRSILDFNGIDGIGYSKMSDLESFDFHRAGDEGFKKAYEVEKRDFYDQRMVRDKMVGAFTKLMES